jgi:type IV pilus modification protein PilV
MSPRHCDRRSQRGTTLLEGMVAFLVLSLGMLSVVRVQTQLRLNSDVARQRSEAVRLAQEDLEKMRAFSSIAIRAGANAYAGLATGASSIDASSGQPSNTTYALKREVSDTDVPNAKAATVSVAWDDRNGTQQRVVLNSVISASDPAYAGALKVAPRLQPVRGVLARSASIPSSAADLGNGSSAFKPLATGVEAWLIDNLSGAIRARCTGINPGLPSASLRAADLGTCEPLRATLLSGVVRFSDAVPPDPSLANDVPAALSVALALTGSATGAASSCAAEARKTVSYSLAGLNRTEGLPLSATATSMGADSWRETGERYLAYHCAITPAATSSTWSGRATLVPTGWTIGNGPDDRRVCRYAPDLDRSGAIDNNLEHPDTYTAVATSLTNQNYLVVNGSQVCPPRPTGTLTTGSLADLGTAPHQP